MQISLAQKAPNLPYKSEFKDEVDGSKTDTDMEQIDTSSSNVKDPNVLSSDSQDEKI